MALTDTRPATADRLMSLARSGALPRPAFERAIALACASPEPIAWRRFLDWLLLGLGSALVLAGVVFFVAFNWAQLGHFAKLGLAAVLVAAAATGAFRLGLEGLPGKISLTAAAVLVGPLLAIFGQSYQTGADPYELFVGWAALISIWVAIARFPPLWLIALVLVNVAVCLFWAQVLDGSSGWEPDRHSGLPVAIAALNTGAWVGWELFARRGLPSFQGRWIPRLLATVCLGLLAMLTVTLIFDSQAGGFLKLAPVLLLIPMWVATVAYFLTARRDLYMLAAASGSAMVVFTSAFGKVLFTGRNAAAEAVLFVFLLGAFAILEVGAVAWWLRTTHRRWEAAPQ